MAENSGGPAAGAGEQTPRRTIRLAPTHCTFAQLPCLSAGLKVRLTALYGVIRGTSCRHIHVLHGEECPVRIFGLGGTCTCEPEIVLCGRSN